MKQENKERYIKDLKKRFRFHKRTYKLFLKHIEYFENAEEKYSFIKHSYKIGDDVYLKKGTFIHGTRKGIEALDLILENGFLSTNIVNPNAVNQKTPYCVSMWNLKEDIYLKDYIVLYSGMTIKYTDFEDKPITKLVPFNNLDSEIENSRKMNYFMWKAEQTKEIRFLPSLIRDDNQLAFIINTESEYAKRLIQNDIFNLNFDKKILKTFISKWFIENFISGKRDDFTTDRESAIIFGIPSCFIEGVLVGKILEKDNEKLQNIKEKLPNVYICNLEGKVIRM